LDRIYLDITEHWFYDASGYVCCRNDYGIWFVLIYELSLFSLHEASIMPKVLESRLIIFMRH